MKLEKKHLAPYLPYDVRALNQVDGYKQLFTIRGFNDRNEVSGFGDSIVNFLDKIEPILFPIEYFAESVNNEFELFNQKGNYNNEIIDLFCYENTGIDDYTNCNIMKLPYECVEYLFKNRIDVFGLIDAGLAKPVTDDFNPYK